jgi:uncharacterized protein YjbI with pentapeptide repeats
MSDKPDVLHFGEREPVANGEHLTLLRKGAAIWNEWRLRNPNEKPDLCGKNLSGANLHAAYLYDAYLYGTNLSGANLSGANLSGANLGAANLSGATLSGATLSRADLHAANLSATNLSATNLCEATLSEADLSEADLSEANLHAANLGEVNLSGANLRGANLGGANLRGAYLRAANLSHAVLMNTIFADVDIGTTNGLDNCVHFGPSIINFQTLSLSGDLPRCFLRGCGLPDIFIDYLPSLRDVPIQFYSCFISYSAEDQVFAERLHADLQNKGVPCWFAAHDLPIGANIWDAIDDAIRLRDKLLVILSEASIASDWVEDEVSKAYAEERERKQTILLPIRIDDALMTTQEAWARKLLDQRNIGDFRLWEKPVEYQRSLERLLRDMKTSAGEK